ncbi:hypothetical protein M885DRAFT_612251, partial [Pelagophyceae sp. CCMP2097]
MSALTSCVGLTPSAAVVARLAFAAAGRAAGTHATPVLDRRLLAPLLQRRRVVGLALEPAAEAVGCVRDPALLVFQRAPTTELRQLAANVWPTQRLQQVGWSEYVFGSQTLFGKRPLVFAAPPGGESDAYLEHAAELAKTLHFVCLADAAAAAALAKAAACPVLAAHGDLDGEEARAKSSMTAAALNVYVGAGVLQLVGGQGTAGALAVVGPRYREATSIFDRAREAAAKLDDA